MIDQLSFFNTQYILQILYYKYIQIQNSILILQCFNLQTINLSIHPYTYLYTSLKIEKQLPFEYLLSTYSPFCLFQLKVYMLIEQMFIYVSPKERLLNNKANLRQLIIIALKNLSKKRKRPSKQYYSKTKQQEEVPNNSKFIQEIVIYEQFKSIKILLRKYPENSNTLTHIFFSEATNNQSNNSKKIIYQKF
ncbi:hypothetical protein ABPG72_020305 [Tetrahymena utriculariae]